MRNKWLYMPCSVMDNYKEAVRTLFKRLQFEVFIFQTIQSLIPVDVLSIPASGH